MSKKSLYLFPLSLFMFSLISQGAFAKSPLSVEQSELLNKFATESSNYSSRELDRLFDLKNSKGEQLFGRPAQKNEANLWATLDSKKDNVEGTSTEKIYQEFSVPTGKRNEIIVAVIDSGVDITHEDLKGHIWTHPKHLHCGYKDDIHGWNFLGNKNGQNVDATTLEVTRVYAKLLKKKEQGILSTEEATLFTKVESDYLAKKGNTEALLKKYQAFDAAIKLLKANGLNAETVAAVDAIQSSDPEIIKAASLAHIVFSRNHDSAYVAAAIKEFTAGLEFQYNIKFDSSSIVGDNPNQLDEVGYGNNDVIGPDPSHGTHVSGIIAANRLNNIGILGQASNVKIMVIRAVPNGDERDKDVANAIRYAVIHGARVINMSFGKDYSPQKSYVDAAVRFAEKHGVILIHAAGNDGKNTESANNNFPNRKMVTVQGSIEAKNWIEVGASSKNKDATLPADFSNFGKTSVDLFAPGVNIVSTIPGNKYASYDGTSMASPEVAGVAALILSFEPRLQPSALRSLLLKSSVTYPGLQVAEPGSASSQMVDFASLSATGGIVNSYQALSMILERQKRNQELAGAK